MVCVTGSSGPVSPLWGRAGPGPARAVFAAWSAGSRHRFGSSLCFHRVLCLDLEPLTGKESSEKVKRGFTVLAAAPGRSGAGQTGAGSAFLGLLREPLLPQPGAGPAVPRGSVSRVCPAAVPLSLSAGTLPRAAETVPADTSVPSLGHCPCLSCHPPVPSVPSCLSCHPPVPSVPSLRHCPCLSCPLCVVAGQPLSRLTGAVGSRASSSSPLGSCFTPGYFLAFFLHFCWFSVPRATALLCLGVNWP